jgi:hypothetical protein
MTSATLAESAGRALPHYLKREETTCCSTFDNPGDGGCWQSPFSERFVAVVIWYR